MTDGTADLIVGITGHRYIAPDDARLSSILIAEIGRFRDAEPERPLVLLSSLAEGADRLAARVARESHGARLEAPLPMPPAEYEKDFATAESRAEFHRFLALADPWYVVAGPDGSVAREGGYARAGAHLVTRCSVLIAIWDGLPARGAGGTGDLVDWVRTGRVPEDLLPESIEMPSRRTLIHVDPVRGEVRRSEEASTS